MIISPQNKRNIKRIIPFGMIWLIIGWVLMWSEYAVLGNRSDTLDSAITLTAEIIVFASLSVFLVGVLVGIVEVFFVNSIFEQHSFKQKILGKFLIYAVLLSVLIFILYMLAASIELKTSVFDRAVWNQYQIFFFSITHLSTSVQLAFSLIVSLIYSEISENLGNNVLMNFFTGKYHRPKEERRIFMFLDMKASTAIAEQLGHIKYFELLKRYYADFSDAIIEHSAEVYQYIGDEIVITWKYEDGIKNNNCIKCFFAMKESIVERKERYESNFGVCPDFKAGIHYGKVTTGEIGALKKEIIFTGDVLNTTSRIQSLCSEKGFDFLVSSDLMEHLNLDADFQVKPLGNTALKGKEKNIKLFTIADAK